MRTSLIAVLWLLVITLTGCTGGAEVPDDSRRTAAEGSAGPDDPYRPVAHYTPPKNWMNDPNGLVYHNGTYHLYYQHNPLGNTWGKMSWGHATSTDLMHWTEQPLALGAVLLGLLKLFHSRRTAKRVPKCQEANGAHPLVEFVGDMELESSHQLRGVRGAVIGDRRRSGYPRAPRNRAQAGWARCRAAPCRRRAPDRPWPAATRSRRARSCGRANTPARSRRGAY